MGLKSALIIIIINLIYIALFKALKDALHKTRHKANVRYMKKMREM